jgi:hypothetical protein
LESAESRAAGNQHGADESIPSPDWSTREKDLKKQTPSARRTCCLARILGQHTFAIFRDGTEFVQAVISGGREARTVIMKLVVAA